MMPNPIPKRNSVHEKAILCAKLVGAGKFVHEKGILCAKLVGAGKFVHEKAILCANWSKYKK